MNMNEVENWYLEIHKLYQENLLKKPNNSTLFYKALSSVFNLGNFYSTYLNDKISAKKYFTKFVSIAKRHGIESNEGIAQLITLVSKDYDI